MKLSVPAVLVSVVAFQLGAAEPPTRPLAHDLAMPVQIRAGETPLDVQREGHAAPDVGDFDGDGVRDLLVGQYHEGRLRIYRNLGTNDGPRFDDFSWFLADGEMGRVQEGCCIGFTPQLVDLDRDGRVDLISGSWPGEILFFRRSADGRFETGRPLQDDQGQPVNVGHRGSPFVVDWDADGTLDLLVGNITGDVHFVPGKLVGNQPQFGKPQTLAAAGEPLHIAGGEAAPVAADWDSDGKLDLIVGTAHGSVFWFRNLGSSHEPKLDAAQTLVGESPVGWGGDEKRAPHDWGLRVRPCVVDWNGDGKLDLLLGDRCGGFLAKPSQTDQEKQEELQAHDRLPELRRLWSTAFQSYQRLQAASSSEDELNPARAKVTRLKDEIARLQQIQEQYQPGYQAHGFVWVFLRQSSSDVTKP